MQQNLQHVWRVNHRPRVKVPEHSRDIIALKKTALQRLNYVSSAL